MIIIISIVNIILADWTLNVNSKAGDPMIKAIKIICVASLFVSAVSGIIVV